jgi:release factor glutamine methyltransferase
VFLLRPPGVYPTQRDTWLLAETLRQIVRPGHRVLDLCTGTGALAVTAALAGGRVTAVDLSRRAVHTARTNARLHRTKVHAVHGDLTAPVTGRVFGVVVSNPPYVPATTDELPTHGRYQAFDAGRDGRILISRVITAAPSVLAPGGRLLLVHSALCGVQDTLDELHRSGLHGKVIQECTHPFGPVLTERAELLETRGLVPHGGRTERLVVIEAHTATVPAIQAR